MDNCIYDRKCLICCRPARENSSIQSEKLVSNTSLLQDFLSCFHNNVPDGDVPDLSTSCHFCHQCEQFILEWSRIQTQMTQLTRRAAQLKSTLSALLLSAPQAQEQSHNEHVNQIVNRGIQISQHVKLPLLLQQTVDDIRNELRKKYSVRVMLEKIPLAAVLQTLDPLAAHNDNLYDAPNHWESGAGDCNLMLNKIPPPPVLKLDPLELDPMPPMDNADNVNETWDNLECEASFQLPIVPKIEPSSVCYNNDDEPWDNSGLGAHDSDEEYLPSEDEWDDEETSERILGLSTETEDNANCDDDSLQDSVHSQGVQVKAGNSPTNGCPRQSETQPAVIRDGPNKFKYNGYDITFNDQDQCYYCGVCNFKGYSVIQSILAHIRTRHYTAEDKRKFTAVKISNTDWLYGGKYKIIKEANKFKCVECGYVRSSLHTLVFHVRSQHVNLECPEGKSNCSLPSNDFLNDEETSEPILGIRIKTEVEAICDDSHSQVPADSTETQAKAANSQTNGCPKRKQRPYKSKAMIPDGPNRFKYKGMSFQWNEEDRTYTCDACGFKCGPTSLSIFPHVRRHLTGKEKREFRPVVVPDGPNRFKYNGYDVRLNEEDQCYYCGVCNFNGTSRLSTLLAHIREMHYTAEDKVKFTAVQISDKEWLYGGKYKIIKEDEKKFKCLACGSLKTSLLYAVAHIRTQHVDLQGPDEAVALPDTATTSVNDLIAIQGELETVPYTFNPADNKYKCGQCETQVSTWNSLSRHIRQSHTGVPKKFPCEICGKELSSLQTYRTHVRLHETFPLKCPTCSKEFLGEHNFKKHMELHELGEEAKKYQCEFCGKKLLTQKSYKHHRRLHTGEKPYECKICGEKFLGTSYLTRHRTSVHGIQPRSRVVVKVSK